MRFFHSTIPWHKVPMLMPLTGVAMGILLYWHIFLASAFCPIVIVGMMAMLFLIWQPSKLFQYLNYIRNISVLCLFATLSYCISYVQDIRNDPKWYGHHIQDTEYLQVVLQSPPEYKQKVIQATAQVQACLIKDTWVESVGTLQVNLYIQADNRAWKEGDRFIIPNRVQPIQWNGNPFSFDPRAYWQLKGIFHLLFLSQEAVLRMEDSAYVPSYVSRMRQYIIETVTAQVADTNTAALINAVIVNERAQMDKNTWEDYSRTGIAHIVAISGMHITIFFVVLSSLIFWIKSRKYHWLKYAIAIPLIWMYILLTGYPPSAVRAGVMFTCIAIGMCINRRVQQTNILFAAASILLLFKTTWLFDVGFQLSFLSVLSIFIFYEPIVKLIQPKYMLLKYVWNTMAISIAVQILLIPLLMYYFNQIPIWSVIVNVPASLYSFIFMILSLVIIIFGSMGINMQWLGDVVHRLTVYFNKMVSFFSDISPASMFSIQINVVEFWLLTIAIIVFSVWILNKNKLGFWIGLATTILVIISFAFQAIQSSKQQIFIVYSLNNKSLYSFIQGNSNIQYQSDKVEAKDYTYTTQKANIGFMVKNSLKKPLTGFMCQVDTMKILHLPGAMKMKDIQHIDVIIVSADVVFNPSMWKEQYNPSLIVIDTSIPRTKARDMKETLEAYGLEAWVVHDQGAWVYKR